MFKQLKELPADPTFELFFEYLDDKRDHKINLGIGLYFDRQGQPLVLPVIKEAFKELDLENFNYQPIGGNRQFLEHAAAFFFGENYDKDKLAMQSTCGGTQACRTFSDLAMKVLHNKTIQLALPSWVNYYALFQQMKIETFDHLKADQTFNFEGYLKAAKEAPKGSAFLIQGGLSHNPAGLNFSLW